MWEVTAGRASVYVPCVWVSTSGATSQALSVHHVLARRLKDENSTLAVNLSSKMQEKRAKLSDAIWGGERCGNLFSKAFFLIHLVFFKSEQTNIKSLVFLKSLDQINKLATDAVSNWVSNVFRVLIPWSDAHSQTLYLSFLHFLFKKFIQESGCSLLLLCFSLCSAKHQTPSWNIQ